MTKTLSQVQNQHPYPIVLMGDLNTGYFQPSQQLLRQGQVEAFGRHWQIPMTFTDAWAELHPGNPDPSTINDDPVRLDYVSGSLMDTILHFCYNKTLIRD